MVASVDSSIDTSTMQPSPVRCAPSRQAVTASAAVMPPTVSLIG